MNKTLLLAAFLGLISVIMGSLTDHYFKANVDEKSVESMLTAVRYNQIFAILLVALGLARLAETSESLNKKLKISACIFSMGIILFAFSIYASVILANRDIVYITPFGGVTLILGWVYLMYVAVTFKK